MTNGGHPTKQQKPTLPKSGAEPKQPQPTKAAPKGDR